MRMTFTRRLLGLLLLTLASGCEDGTAPAVSISVSVAPASASLLAGGLQDFTGTVANDPAAQGVTWSISGCTGGAAVCGGLTNVTSTTTTYLAPATVPPSSLGVTATSVADNTKSFTATVAFTGLGAGVVYLFPPSVPLLAGGTQSFTATVENGAWDVTWAITGCTGGADVCGELTNVFSSSARYTAPATIARDTEIGITATSVNDPRHSTTATVTLSATRLSGRIAFAGDFQIYSMNAGGSGLTRLTADPYQNGQPAWSPDGARIAFWSNRAGNRQIFAMNADGSGVTQLTNDPTADCFRPAWSPDGTKIAYTRSIGSSFGGGGLQNGDIWVINADGSGPVQITNEVTGDSQDLEAWDYWPTWSPDGTKVAFQRTRWRRSCSRWGCGYAPYGPAIVAANADGSSAQVLVGGLMPAWSPDGTRIAFATEPAVDPDYYDVFVINLDGSGLTRLTQPVANFKAANYRPAWSPDGTRIVFWSTRDDNSFGALYVMNADGSGVVKVTRDDVPVDGTPAWRR